MQGTTIGQGLLRGIPGVQTIARINSMMEKRVENTVKCETETAG